MVGSGLDSVIEVSSAAAVAWQFAGRDRWADPTAGLVLAGLAVREGVNARRGDTCCAPRPGVG